MVGIRRMTFSDIGSAMQLKDSVGWNQVEWPEQLGISKQREFVRMYLGEKTEVSEELQYLIAGPEFG